MTGIIFDGKRFAGEKEEKLMGVVGGLRPSFVPPTGRTSAGKDIGKVPKLVAILVGENPEGELYLRLKEKVARRLGIKFEFRKFSANSPQEISYFIERKNIDSEVGGIIVELPLPPKFNIQYSKFKILDAINPKKDVDCLTSENLRLLKKGCPNFMPPTVKAVIEILMEATGTKSLKNLKDKRIVVVGDRGMVGEPLVAVLENSGLRVEGANTSTGDLTALTKSADILISAAGVGRLIKKEMVKQGAVVIDVGIEKKRDFKVVGDVDFENIKEIASFITPVPGGVGPVTITCLMENLLQNMYH